MRWWAFVVGSAMGVMWCGMPTKTVMITSTISMTATCPAVSGPRNRRRPGRPTITPRRVMRHRSTPSGQTRRTQPAGIHPRRQWIARDPAGAGGDRGGPRAADGPVGVGQADTVRQMATQPGHPVLPVAHRRAGNLLDVTEMGRFPSRKLGMAVRFRDGTCSGPTCTRPAADCDIDHLVPVPTGRTTASNLNDKC